MVDFDFANNEMHRRFLDALLKGYPTKESIESLMTNAHISLSRYPEKGDARKAWEALLPALDLSRDLYGVLDAILKDSLTAGIHDTVKDFRERQPPDSSVGASPGVPDPVELLSRTLHRHLGRDARTTSEDIVNRIAKVNNISGSKLFDATRFAIEYQLFTAEELTPTLIVDVASGLREDSLKEFRELLQTALRKGFDQIVVKAEPHRFFAKTVERQEDWFTYFDALRDMMDASSTIGTTLCRVRSNGFVAPQFLVAGMLSSFADDWRPIIATYEKQLENESSPFVSLQASLWNTWLMWGPSIPICECQEWEGIRALQFGYGDENNSLSAIGADQQAPISLEAMPGAYESREPPVGAVLRRLTGRLRWAPWLFRRSNGPGSQATSGVIELPVKTSPAANAQRLMYTEDPKGQEQDPLVFQVDEVRAGNFTEQSYYTAYLWLMFLVSRRPVREGEAPRRLADKYPDPGKSRNHRIDRKLWRELVPVYVHANIADARALRIHKRSLVDNAVALLRHLWAEQATLFPEVSRSELCFCLVGGSDYSGCGSAIRFPSRDPLLARLRARVAEEPDRDFASSILLPPDGETVATRPRELAQYYAACHLPDLVEDYYLHVKYVEKTPD